MNEEKRYYYAELNNEGICVSVLDLSGIVEKSTIIPIDSYDVTLLGKKYTGNTWEDVPIEYAEQEPTFVEQLRADIDYLAAMTGVEL